MNKTSELTALISKYLRRFESFVTLGIVILISIMILAAFWGLVVETYHLLSNGMSDSFGHKAFQSVFGMVMTLLIAIELNRTIMHSNMDYGREVIVKTVVLIAILAVSRQFIVFEIETASPTTLAALAFSLISLGTVYWLMEKSKASSNKNDLS